MSKLWRNQLKGTTIDMSQLISFCYVTLFERISILTIVSMSNYYRPTWKETNKTMDEGFEEAVQLAEIVEGAMALAKLLLTNWEQFQLDWDVQKALYSIILESQSLMVETTQIFRLLFDNR